MEYITKTLGRGAVSNVLTGWLWLCLSVAAVFSTAAFAGENPETEKSQTEEHAPAALKRGIDGTPENPENWYALGEKYYRGIDGAPPDYARALSYWLPPAEKNNYAPAMHGIGLLYLNGHGVAKNAATAYGWFHRAAGLNHAPSFYRLGRLFDEGAGVPRSQVAAAEWYRRGVLFGDMDAMYALGMHYYEGAGVRKSYTNAYRLWLRCAETGNRDAQFNIGTLYENGKGVQKDLDEARQWYDRAAEQGHEGALKALEEMLSLKN